MSSNKNISISLLREFENIGTGSWSSVYTWIRDKFNVYIDSNCPVKRLISGIKRWKSARIPVIEHSPFAFDYIARKYTVLENLEQLSEQEQEILQEFFDMFGDLMHCEHNLLVECNDDIRNRLDSLTNSPFRTGLLELFDFLYDNTKKLYLDVRFENLGVYRKKIILLDCFCDMDS